jgi:hypothetical protein
MVKLSQVHNVAISRLLRGRVVLRDLLISSARTFLRDCDTKVGYRDQKYITPKLFSKIKIPHISHTHS